MNDNHASEGYGGSPNGSSEGSPTQADNGGRTEPNIEIPESPSLTPPPPGLWAGEAPMGSITSPSESGKYKMALRNYATTAQVEGSLVALDYDELGFDGKRVKKTVLCQVTHMTNTNQHHERPLYKAIIRERGRIPGLSGYADHKEVDLLPMDCVIADTDIRQLPRTIPPTGTDVRFASINDIAQFSTRHHSLYNIGYLYETRVPVGLVLKHFGPGDDGWGDAHMLGVFGATGSGKTAMAMSVVAGFAARPEMGMLIVDPQGQISSYEMGKDPKKWSWRLDEAFRLVGRGPDVELVSIEKIALESPRLFAQLLDRYDFFDALNIMGAAKKEDMVRDLATLLEQWLKDNQGEGRTLGDLVWNDELLTGICNMGASQYADPKKKAKSMAEGFEAAPYKVRRAQAIWDRVREMFARPTRLGDLLDDVLINRRIIILNVDAEESIKDLYCGEILDGIKKKAETIYRIKQGQFRRGDPAGKYRDAQINALIVIDEAHRVAPQYAGPSPDQERMRRTLEDATRTTRKLGVGWCYITQSIASFNKEIFRQLGTKVLGFGIGTGADNDHLESAFNHDSDLIAQYRRLPRPLSTNVYPFAIIGELVALGNGSRALFITAPRDQADLIRLNPNHYKYPDGKPVSATSQAGRQPQNGHGSLTLAGASASQGMRQLPLPPTQGSDDVPF